MSDDDRETNRAHWDALAAVHGQDDYYDAEALVGGADTLSRHEDAAVGEVAGLDVLHLQCHIGFDSISLARRGARVTGADFSPASLAKGRDLAARAGVEVEFVEADATALPPRAARALRPRLRDDGRDLLDRGPRRRGCARCTRRCGPAAGSCWWRSTRSTT